MTTPEGIIQKAIQKEITRRGWFVFKVHGSPTMMKGLPDLIVCAEGLYIGIEVKTPQTLHTVSEAQKLRGEQITAAGGMWGVAASVAEAMAIIEAAMDRRGHRKPNLEPITAPPKRKAR